MKLFRGQNAQVWQERLQALGWPPLAAEDMAHFLVGDDTQREPPTWSNMLLSSGALREVFEREPLFKAYVCAVKAHERRQ